MRGNVDRQGWVSTSAHGSPNCIRELRLIVTIFFTTKLERPNSRCMIANFQCKDLSSPQIASKRVVLMANMKDSEVEFKSSTKHDEAALSESSTAPKLDPHGFPLRPQPSDDPLGTGKEFTYSSRRPPADYR